MEKETRESDGDLSKIDNELWRYFHPDSTIGKQVYESYTDDELLSFVLKTMDRPGHQPKFNDIFCVYKKYLKRRFNGLDKVKSLAITRRKQLEEEKKWPPNWTDFVSAEPMLERCKKRGHTLSENDINVLNRICEVAIKTGFPQSEKELSKEAKDLFKRLCGTWQKGLLIMGIPALNKMALNHLKKYWIKERGKGAIQGE